MHCWGIIWSFGLWVTNQSKSLSTQKLWNVHQRKAIASQWFILHDQRIAKNRINSTKRIQNMTSPPREYRSSDNHGFWLMQKPKLLALHKQCLTLTRRTSRRQIRKSLVYRESSHTNSVLPTSRRRALKERNLSDEEQLANVAVQFF